MGMSGTEGGSLPGYRFPLWARAMSGVALYATAIFWISQLGYSQYYPDSPAVAPPELNGVWLSLSERWRREPFCPSPLTVFCPICSAVT